MIIIRADHLGMCFGVRDAIQLAFHEAQRQPLTILGELVHNERVLDDLRAHRIQTELESDRVKTRSVMITAHGVSERRLSELRQRGLDVIEATCPLVRAAHRAVVSMVQAGFYPVIVGQAAHVEVRGLTEDLPEYSVVLHEAELERIPVRARYGVAAQTTQPVDRVRALAGALRRRFPEAEVRLVDTVCQPTKLRQHAAEELAKTCDVVVVVGGARSNNTRELVETCGRYCRRVHHVQGPDGLDADWLDGAERVGLTAGTSTPDELIRCVEERLKQMAVHSTSAELAQAMERKP